MTTAAVAAAFAAGAAAPAQAAPPDQGPGGPILVITGANNQFGAYYAEILRNEGLNAFDVAPLATVDQAMLANHDVAILADTAVSAGQASMLDTWVQSGGNLIAMRPDAQLSGLVGLTSAGGTLGNAYLKVDTTAAPGTGIANATMQFHGTADRYTANAGTTTVATLYSDASTATTNPAVTLRSAGSGRVAAFTYDLARSVVYTRQGNPAWVGDERDGVSPVRSDDLFFGAKAGDVQPDWVDLSKVAIPQADEQQRLLANLIEKVQAAKTPIPRFWYFPHGKKAAVVMTADDHGSATNVQSRFDDFLASSPAGCSVADWQCVRGTAYTYPATGLTAAQATAYEGQGFEVAAHVDTNCADYTQAQLEAFFSSQLTGFATQFPGVPAPTTNRTHCIAWDGWVTQPQVESGHGIRFDTNYYYWPGSWVQNRPGMFTGSGMPMRFADTDGTMVDVYQAATQITDESGQAEPATIDALLDKAVGSQGYYGAFTANMHTDAGDNANADAVVASAQSRGVPVVSARQMLTWLDARNASSFGSLSFSGNTLGFTIARAANANGLTAMVPAHSSAGALSGLERDGNAVSYTTQTIKGVQYAFVDAVSGSYQATYAPEPSGLVDTSTTDFGAGSASGTQVTDASGGELQLGVGLSEDFNGLALPGDWTSTLWNPPTGSVNVGGGTLNVDGGVAGTTATYAPGRTLEFRATFSGQAFEHVGLGTDYNAAPWAMFSTYNTTNQLYARTDNGTQTANTPLPGVVPGGTYDFKIVWNPGSVDYYVDGVLMATHAIAIGTSLRPLASSYNTGTPLSIDWLRMSPPYATPGVFTSRVMDAGQAVDWAALTWTADTPAGTAVALEVRTGDTATPDGSWTAWSAVVSSGGAIGGHSRYVQYRATLTTTDPSATPVLQDVTAAYGIDTTAPDTVIDSGPSGLVNTSTASFAFYATEGGATFACSMDGGAFASCASPQSYGSLTDGPHTFAVRATDVSNNTDATPATRSFTVDTAAPSVTLDPVAVSGSSATVTFTSEAGATFACSLDGAAFAPCTSGHQYTGLADGSHSVAVRATDTAGNTGPAATRSFTVATTSGSLGITFQRPWQGARYSAYANPKPELTAAYSCSGATSCTASVDGNDIAVGQAFPRPDPSPAPSVIKTFTVTASDGNGQTLTKSVTYRVYTFASLIADLDPLAYWRLGDGEGASTLRADTGPDGEYKNGQDSEPYGISGDGDAARQFTGADGYAFVNGVTAPRNYTLSVFFRLDDGARSAMIMQHGGAGAIWYDGDAGVLRFKPVDWDGVTLSSPAVSAGAWHHVAGTFGAGTAKLYLDGTLVDTQRSLKATSGTSTLYLGYGDKAPWLQGALDEAAYFARALDGDQVHQIWLADPPPTKSRAAAATAPAAAAPAAAAAGAAPTTVDVASTTAAMPAKVARLALRARTLSARVTCASRCSGTLVATVRIGSRTVRLAAKRYSLSGSGRVTVRLSASAQRLLASRSPRTVTVRLRDAGGEVVSTSRGVVRRGHLA